MKYLLSNRQNKKTKKTRKKLFKKKFNQEYCKQNPTNNNLSKNNKSYKQFIKEREEFLNLINSIKKQRLLY